MGTAPVDVLRRSSTVALVCWLDGSAFTNSLTGLLPNDVHHTVLEGLLVLGESVLLPSVVEHSWVEVVPRHAPIEESLTCPVVGLLLELECAAVLHELTELRGLSAAKFLQRSLNLLLLDIVVLLVL